MLTEAEKSPGSDERDFATLGTKDFARMVLRAKKLNS
jgi:hypothetical protein